MKKQVFEDLVFDVDKPYMIQCGKCGYIFNSKDEFGNVCPSCDSEDTFYNDFFMRPCGSV